MQLGAHVSIAGGIENAPGRAAGIGCDAFQVFSHNQMQWRFPSLKPGQAEKFQTALEEYGLPAPVFHCSYLLNLCADNKNTLKKSYTALKEEFLRAAELGVPGIILHPGAARSRRVRDAVRMVHDTLVDILAQTPSEVAILLENTAGQGTLIGSEMKTLSEMVLSLARRFPGRSGLCFDTCHAYAAGYDIRDNYQETFKKLLDFLPLKYWHVLHLNDCKKELGSHADRHAQIGKGELGNGFFSRLINDKRFEELWGILEIPGGMEAYQTDLEHLRHLRAMRK